MGYLIKQANPSYKQLFKILYKPKATDFGWSFVKSDNYSKYEKLADAVSNSAAGPASIRYADLSKPITERVKGTSKDLLRDIIKAKNLTDDEIRAIKKKEIDDWWAGAWDDNFVEKPSLFKFDAQDIIDARNKIFGKATPLTREQQVADLFNGFKNKLKSVHLQPEGLTSPLTGREAELLSGMYTGTVNKTRRLNPRAQAIIKYKANQQYVTGNDFSDPRISVHVTEQLKNNPVAPNSILPIPTDPNVYSHLPYLRDIKPWRTQQLYVHTPGLPHTSPHAVAELELNLKGATNHGSTDYEHVTNAIGAKNSYIKPDGIYMPKTDKLRALLEAGGHPTNTYTYKTMQGNDQGFLFRGVYNDLRKPTIENLYNATDAKKARKLIDDIFDTAQQRITPKPDSDVYRFLTPYVQKTREYAGLSGRQYNDLEFYKVPASVYMQMMKGRLNTAPTIEALQATLRNVKKLKNKFKKGEMIDRDWQKL